MNIFQSIDLNLMFYFKNNTGGIDIRSSFGEFELQRVIIDETLPRGLKNIFELQRVLYYSKKLKQRKSTNIKAWFTSNELL